ncbi:MAG: LysM peptidoglycan-binding domain-containing protein [Victivallaceae bacterium]|nr:LysM peptidoglycan-binding domain-containing protein [Victivallaceae bacterium]
MINYSYNYGSGQGPRQGGWFRFVLIFLIVCAVTAGIIYLIVPKKTDAEPIKTAEPAATTSPTSGAVSAPQPAGADPAAVREVQELQGTPEEKTVATPATEDGNNNPQPTADPVKGVPWTGDVASDKDVPSKPISQERAAEEMALTENNMNALLNGASGACITYTVGRGDYLTRVASKHHTTMQAIKKINKLDRDSLRIGEKLKICPGPWKIVISLSNRRLNLYNLSSGSEKLFGAYDVGIGRQGKTPVADFTIRARLFHPSYTAPDGSVFKYGVEGNPLGSYFLKLEPVDSGARLTGYGIHGADPATVCRSLSHGCIRMRDEEVGMIYLLCPVSTPVSIVE